MFSEWRVRCQCHSSVVACPPIEQFQLAFLGESFPSAEAMDEILLNHSAIALS